MNLWMLQSNAGEHQPLEEHLELLIAFIEEHLEALSELTRMCEIDLFCGFSSLQGQGGFTLSASLLKRLTALPIDLGVDLYRPHEDSPA